MQSIGERLEEARKRRGITVREASEATKIRGEYLNNFESNTFKMNLPDIYVRGFLRSYANYLRLNSDKIITDYNAHLISEGKSSRRDTREFLGRLELQQQPIISEEPKNAGAIDDAQIEEAENEAPSTPIWERFNIEKDVAIKIGIFAGLAALVVIVLVWGFLAFVGSEEPVTDSALTATPAAIAPATNATPFTLIANEDVRVEVKEADGEQRSLFFAVLPQGQEKVLYATGTVLIYYNDFQALSVKIGETTYRMVEGKTSIRVTPSKLANSPPSGN